MDRQDNIAKSRSVIKAYYLLGSHKIFKMMLGLCLLHTPWLSASADNGNVDGDGDNGVLYITGALSQGACRLEMNSAKQLVSLGNISTGDLNAPGTEADPVPFQIILRDCLLTGGHQRDAYTGNNVWDASQPVVSVSFVAPADADMPQLIKVAGAKGLALRLLDSRHQDVRLGNRSQPQFIDLYNDVLTYYVVPVRTAGPLQPGAFNAVVNFRLNYD
ncbi:fimbrial protein [Erwinia endophytica]|uniref:fimbrial protein n=1 Tax=Erwinia endophytica TaxID=1563158 RepID=UPI001F033FA7|nr:fimbrial protein [Erwinia endophytica]